MRRKFVLAVVLAAIALVLAGGFAWADTSTGVTQKTVHMQGQAAIIRSRAASQLRIKINSTDGAGWLLEVALNPVITDSSGNNGSQLLRLSGSFTLGTPQHPVVSGTATGWLNQNWSGDINLSGQSGATSLDMPFTVNSDGSVLSDVQGQWPAIQVSVPSSTAAAPTAPSQPTNHFFWYLSRTTAIAAYILLFVSVCLGIGLRSRYLGWILNRWQTLDLHLFTALLAMALFVVHIFSLLGDSYFSFGFAQLLLPMSSPYRQMWTALGVAGFYAAVIVTFSFYFRKFVGQRLWRILHYIAFILFLGILLHSIKAGTDSAAPWAKWLYVITGAIAVFLFLWRFLSPGASERIEAETSWNRYRTVRVEVQPHNDKPVPPQ